MTTPQPEIPDCALYSLIPGGLKGRRPACLFFHQLSMVLLCTHLYSLGTGTSVECAEQSTRDAGEPRGSGGDLSRIDNSVGIIYRINDYIHSSFCSVFDLFFDELAGPTRFNTVQGWCRRYCDTVICDLCSGHRGAGDGIDSSPTQVTARCH